MTDTSKPNLPDFITSLMQKNKELSSKIDELNKENAQLSDSLEKSIKQSNDPNILIKTNGAGFMELSYKFGELTQKDGHFHVLPNTNELASSNLDSHSHDSNLI